MISFDMFATAEFWTALGQIVMIDLLLGGDNAVVIALACRNLPPEQRRKGIFWGVIGAVGLRVVLTIFAVQLLALPYLKLVAGALLVWIGIKLLAPDEDEHGEDIAASDRLWGAVKTILIADATMSIDNVIGVAAAAKGNILLLTLGLLISVPLVVWGSKLVLALIERYSWVILLGGGLLGYVAGEMIETEVKLIEFLGAPPPPHLLPVVGLFTVVLVGKGLHWRAKRAQ